jgi:L-asparagine transporter-like permease
MGSGKTISLAGPSIIFVYMIIGFMLFFVMRAMGELLLSNLPFVLQRDRWRLWYRRSDFQR